MSTAKNHAKRSHRSNYRARMFSGARKSVIRPTVKKSAFMQFIKLLRTAFSRRKEQKPND